MQHRDLTTLETEPQINQIITYADSETWAGNIHPAQALRQYRTEFAGCLFTGIHQHQSKLWQLNMTRRCDFRNCIEGTARF